MRKDFLDQLFALSRNLQRIVLLLDNRELIILSLFEILNEDALIYFSNLQCLVILLRHHILIKVLRFGLEVNRLQHY